MLSISAYSGFGDSDNIATGWRPTSAAFIVAALIAMYGKEFGWPQINEFIDINGLDGWEPENDLTADGVLVAEDGTIYLPDGFNLSGWADYYSDWKAGKVIARLPSIEIPAVYVPENLGWNPEPAAQTTPAPAPAPAPAFTSQPVNASAVNQVSSAAATSSANSSNKQGAVPWGLIVGGGIGLVVLSKMLSGKRK